MSLITTKDDLTDAVRILLDCRRSSRAVRILTHTVADFQVTAGMTFSRMLAQLMASDTTVTLIFGARRIEEPAKDFLRKLQSMGVNVYWNRRMHAKVILAVSSTGAAALIGSANMTQSAMTWSTEACIRGDPLDEAGRDALTELVRRTLKASSTKGLDDAIGVEAT